MTWGVQLPVPHCMHVLEQSPTASRDVRMLMIAPMTDELLS